MKNRQLQKGLHYGTLAFERQLKGWCVSHIEATVPEPDVQEHSHFNAHLIFTTSGRYISSAAGEQRDGPVLIYNPPGVIHRDRFGDQLGWFLAVNFDQATLEDNEHALALPEIAIRSHTGRALSMAYSLLKSARTSNALTLDLEVSLINLLDNFCLKPKLNPKKPPSWLRHAQEMIADMSAHDLRITDIADEIGVHRVYLARQYQRHLGVTPGADLRLRRIQKAMQLLMTSKTSLIEIAALCGYCDQSHLNRALWQHLGLTPGEFRALGISKTGCKNPRPNTKQSLG